MSSRKEPKVIVGDNNQILVFCTFAGEYKPAELFYEWKSSNNGYSPSCINCTFLKRTGHGGIKQDRNEQYEKKSQEDVRMAKEILTKLGYDVNSEIPVYQQFEKRMKEKL